MEFWGLIAVRSEGDRQYCAIGRQDKLGDPQQREALEKLQAEITFHLWKAFQILWQTLYILHPVFA